MAKEKETPKESATTGTASAGSAGTKPQDVTVPVEAGAQAATKEGKPAKPAKPEIPEHLKKGNRICAACLTSEADFLAKNPRYSLCQGVDVLCYRKGDRVIYNQTLEEVNAKYPDKVGKNDDTGRPLISSVSGIGVKPGILVRGAISYSRKAKDTAVPTAAVGATGSAGTTPVG